MSVIACYPQLSFSTLPREQAMLSGMATRCGCTSTQHLFGSILAHVVRAKGHVRVWAYSRVFSPKVECCSLDGILRVCRRGPGSVRLS